MSSGATDFICSSIIAGCFMCVWLGVMCSSWSRARRGKSDYSGWPPPLRDNHDFLFGLPKLSSKDRERVRIGNESLKWCMRVVRLCIKYKVPIVLGNPQSSRLFLAPSLIRLARLASSDIVFDHCQYRGPFKKPTRLIAWNLDISSLERRCHMIGQKCSVTNRPHQQLSGKHGSEFKTAEGAAYPEDFCRAFAHLVKVNSP